MEHPSQPVDTPAWFAEVLQPLYISAGEVRLGSLMQH